MNDRLRFRVWDKQNGCYAYSNNSDVDILYIETDGELTYGVYSNDHEDMIYIPESEVIIEQCTGLKDRNGRLIYENDLVKLLVARNRGWIRKGTIAPVKWGNFTCCGFMLSCLGNLTEKCAKNCEVIGNIHENKDLLK